MIPDKFWSRIGKVQRIHQHLYASGKGWLIGWLILLLHHKGRRTGKAYVTPLQYEKIGDAYCIGAGRGVRADWFKNIQADQSVEISVGRKHIKALAEPVVDPERVADFLQYRLHRHPLMIGSIMKLHHLPMKPSREQLVQLAGSTALVILHPLVEDQ